MTNPAMALAEASAEQSPAILLVEDEATLATACGRV